jgi:hypothetical protein
MRLAAAAALRANLSRSSRESFRERSRNLKIPVIFSYPPSEDDPSTLSLNRSMGLVNRKTV